MVNEAARPEESPPTLRACESADEVSSVRPALLMVTDIEIEILASDRTPWDPAPVYASPVLIVHGQRITYLRRYFLGTHFANGILPALDWQDEMDRDGVAPKLVDRCRRYLQHRAL